MAKKVALKEALAGLEGLYVKGGTTSFTATKAVLVENVGKVQWVEAQLHTWEKKLMRSAGLTAVQMSVSTPHSKPDRDLNYDAARWNYNSQFGRIVIQAEVPGSVNTDGLAPEVASGILSSARKQLALNLLERFPPHFNCWDIPLIAGSVDSIGIMGVSLWPHTRDNHDEIEQGILEGLAKAVAAQGGKLGEVLCSNWHSHYQVQIIWGQDTYDGQKENIDQELEQLIIELWGKKPSLIHFGAHWKTREEKE